MQTNMTDTHKMHSRKPETVCRGKLNKSPFLSNLHGLTVYSFSLWLVYAVHYWAVPDEIWPAWKKCADIFGRGYKMVGLHHTVREVQR